MISYVEGNLFEAPAQTLVNTVNTVGVMGKGIALTFKQTYPAMFKTYQELCESGKLRVGTLFLWRTPHKLVLNFPTKKDWRQPSRPEYVDEGLRTFVQHYQDMGIHSVAFPPLGCGNGELDFTGVVRPIMERRLGDLPIPVLIYAPRKATEPAEHRVPREIQKWLRESPRDLSFLEVWEDLSTLLTIKRSFRTLAKGGKYEATLWSDPPGIRLRAAGKSTVVEKEEVRELWKELQSSGLLTTSAAPPNRERDVSYLLPLFAELPYVRVIEVGDDYENFYRNPSVGILLVPPSMESHQHQLQLA